MRRVLAVASGGGHWAQLQQLLPAFDGCDLVLACAQPVDRQSVRELPDCNVRQPLRVWRCARKVSRLLAEVQPDVIVSTGAAPGALALALGKRRGARTIWIDSVANAERMSLSGRLVRNFSDLWLSQWPDVAVRSGARFEGRVI